jgi:hypothetical protein
MHYHALAHASGYLTGTKKKHLSSSRIKYKARSFFPIAIRARGPRTPHAQKEPLG